MAVVEAILLEVRLQRDRASPSLLLVCGFILGLYVLGRNHTDGALHFWRGFSSAEQCSILLTSSAHNLNTGYRSTLRLVAKLSFIGRACHFPFNFVQDLDKCHMVLLPWSNVARTLRQAWSTTDPAACVWKGVLSPVRRGGGGVHVPVLFKWRWIRLELEGLTALKWEIMWFVWSRYASRALMFLGAILCSCMSIVVLWSEMSVSPIFRLQSADAQRGSLLLSWVCLGAKVPPSCVIQDRLPYAWETPYFVTSAVQNIIILHLFYLCGVAHFSLTRMRLFGLYEVVPGETGPASCWLHHVGSEIMRALTDLHIRCWQTRSVFSSMLT